MEDIFAIVVSISLILAVTLTHWGTNKRWQSDLINRNMAHYCPCTGEWAFKGECEG
jgi:hypothetical protein